MKRLLLLFLIVSAPVFGLDEGWRKSSGKLEVTLLLTNEPQKVMEDWKITGSVLTFQHFFLDEMVTEPS